MPGYKSLMSEYEAKYNEKQQKKRADEGLAEKKQEHVTEIPFTWDGGNCYVKCKINDLPMQFVFDTGASDVSISMVEASFMMKNGYLSKNDVIGSARFSDANGNVSEGTVINLKKVQFGDLELNNVRASVVRNQKAPLLLGQTVLSRTGKIEIDNQKKVIKVTYLK
jgi:clan AA aspartic protease (TIGR02281 family)